MAASFATVIKALGAQGNRREVVVDFTPSTSYPAGGEPVTPALLGMQFIDTVIPVAAGEDGTRIFTWDGTNAKLRIFTAIGTEATTSSDQSAKKCRLVVQGV